MPEDTKYTELAKWHPEAKAVIESRINAADFGSENIDKIITIAADLLLDNEILAIACGQKKQNA